MAEDACPPECTNSYGPGTLHNLIRYKYASKTISTTKKYFFSANSRLAQLLWFTTKILREFMKNFV